MRPHVLLVDDHFTVRRIVSKILEPYATIDQAGNGVEAVKAFKYAVETGETYDLVVLDIHMPIMDGLSALRIIRSKEKCLGWSETPVLVLSSDSTPKTVVDAYYRYGIAGYITKPFRTKAIVDGFWEHVRKAAA